MSVYRCNLCDTLKDGDIDGCETDPYSDDLICPICAERYLCMKCSEVAQLDNNNLCGDCQNEAA